MKRKIDIFTDGSAKGDARGGWSALILEDGVIYTVLKGYIVDTTNQRMELTAAILSCGLAEGFEDVEVYVYSDSAYLVNCANDKWYENWLKNGWVNSKGDPVANQDLWKLLIPFFESDKYHFCKVKGHSDVALNNLADEYAQDIPVCLGEQYESNYN